MKLLRCLALVVLLALGLTGCNNKTISKIENEPDYVQLTGDIYTIYQEASKGCIGVFTKNSDDSYSSGSAVLYKYENGIYYAVTNHHVIEGATIVRAYLGNNYYFEATVLGSDEKNDIAVITFEIGNKYLEKNLFDLVLHDIFNYEYEDLVKIGQNVLVIGCPLGLDNFNNLSTGVVSDVKDDKITTDAALNPGNSGGGIFNTAGRLIGIINAKEVWRTTETGQIPVEGRGYAISLNTVKECIKDIEKYGGEIQRPILGVYSSAVNILLPENENFAKFQDYLPTDIDRIFYVVVDSFSSEESVAKKYGLLENDVILYVDSVEITSLKSISYVLNLKTMDENIVLTVYRKSTNSISDITIYFV